MMSLTDLPLSFWGYALETAAFTLNRAPSKSVETTPYELWFGKKPKLSLLKVWDCDAYMKRFHPDKLKPKSEKYVFIGYPKETVGYTFLLGNIVISKILLRTRKIMVMHSNERGECDLRTLVDRQRKR